MPLRNVPAQVVQPIDFWGRSSTNCECAVVFCPCRTSMRPSVPTGQARRFVSVQEPAQCDTRGPTTIAQRDPCRLSGEYRTNLAPVVAPRNPSTHSKPASGPVSPVAQTSIVDSLPDSTPKSAVIGRPERRIAQSMPGPMHATVIRSPRISAFVIPDSCLSCHLRLRVSHPLILCPSPCSRSRASGVAP